MMNRQTGMPDFRSHILRYLFILISITISILIFLYLMNLGADVVRIHAKTKAFFGMLSLYFYTLAELAFIFFVYFFYSRCMKYGNLTRCFLITTAVELCLFTAVVLVRYLIYVPVYKTINVPFSAIFRVQDYIILGVGVLGGTIFLVLTRFTSKSILKRARRRTR